MYIQAADLAECFRQVPAVFFSRDFELSDPALFEALVVRATPDTQVRGGATGFFPLAVTWEKIGHPVHLSPSQPLPSPNIHNITNHAPGQEKFGLYLDVVETCLLKQIASRSQHFFEALTTLQVSQSVSPA